MWLDSDWSCRNPGHGKDLSLTLPLRCNQPGKFCCPETLGRLCHISFAQVWGFFASAPFSVVLWVIFFLHPTPAILLSVGTSNLWEAETKKEAPSWSSFLSSCPFLLLLWFPPYRFCYCHAVITLFYRIPRVIRKKPQATIFGSAKEINQQVACNKSEDVKFYDCHTFSHFFWVTLPSQTLLGRFQLDMRKIFHNESNQPLE